MQKYRQTLLRRARLGILHFHRQTNQYVEYKKSQEGLAQVSANDREESLGRERGICSGDDVESKSRTGTPTSLGFHGTRLSTFISYSNVDPNGGVISPEQMAKIQSMKHWNKISSNNRSYHRNLKNAFAIFKQCKGQTVAKRRAYRKICLKLSEGSGQTNYQG